MQFFNFDDTKTPTKMFVSELSEPEIAPERESDSKAKEKGVLAGSAITAASNILIKIAPDLIDKGVKFFSSSIANFAEDHVTQTLIYKNIDAHSVDKIFLPKKITIVRANFSTKTDDNSKGELFGDGDKEQDNQVKLISDKELQIEVEVIPSQNSNAVYFQTTSYFYKGEDIEGNDIDEIIIAFAFVPAGHAISAYSELTFQSLLHFKQLENSQHYSFESKSGCDTSYQTPWFIPSVENHTGPYSLVIGIQEVRKGSSFAGLIQDIYTKHEDELTKEIKEQVTQALKGKQENTDQENPKS